MNGISRAILVAAGEDRHLDELGRLAATLGLEVCGRLEQPRRDGAGYLGRGKRRELGRRASELGAQVVVTDDELTASQARVLERDAGLPVMDRTELIIKIFESHARDAASKLQVELAELEYLLPRTRGMWTHLERQEGGGGRGLRGATRGPGEQQLEYDRRMIRDRIRTIRRKLKDERASRRVRSSRLKKSGPPAVALVGYTNAGKTTILNSLSGAGRSVRDWLFETLETSTRLVEGGREDGVVRPDFVVTDTVGFIRKLPTQLVESFAGTLQAAREADVVVICADASSPELAEEIDVVRETLVASGVDAEDAILCLNKLDAVPEEAKREIERRYPQAVKISALKSTDPLKQSIYRSIASLRPRMRILIPHSDYSEVAGLYGTAEIHSSENTAEGVIMDVTLPEEKRERYARYTLG
ncbi:GTPase HflX [Rubrobacter taiwanensis]|jgi:GTP-binding protein HflX|uniref:GTPase HflX n=1 Tax=Rubrobacter taiwanensis TaxID=185139 RepID=A0A4R1BHM5_9ACTN|nr:GTPase HflX [Rubrobacter taiwanensis]TCJ16618.1 GTPase HflX [Rubrobacter taiwanensis]